VLYRTHQANERASASERERGPSSPRIDRLLPPSLGDRVSRDEILDSLQELGFSTNEARAYKGLLVESPATGYEIAQRAGIPRSAIYAVLKRLEDDGLVARVEETPARYAPLPPTDLLGVLRRRFEGSLTNLDGSLRRLRPPPPPVDLWNVTGYDEVMERAVSLINQAERYIFCSTWRREGARLRPALEAAAKRRVKIIAFSFCALDEMPGKVYSYGLDETDLEAFWKHKIILVVDHQRTLMGGAEPQDSEAVVTGHPAITEVALNNIALDVTLLGQRQKLDTTASMVEMLGDRLGSLDPLFSKSKR
jgi:sugar-specific transcriptional regulator TrmB